MGAESPKDECGLFGVWAPGEDVARLTYFGLFAQQHRGQEWRKEFLLDLEGALAQP